jgi:hypothetical protein
LDLLALEEAKASGRTAARPGAGSRMVATSPMGQFSEHLVCSEVAKVDVNLGQLRADLDPGPKTKFAAHMMLYIFY